MINIPLASGMQQMYIDQGSMQDRPKRLLGTSKIPVYSFSVSIVCVSLNVHAGFIKVITMAIVYFSVVDAR